LTSLPKVSKTAEDYFVQSNDVGKGSRPSSIASARANAAADVLTLREAAACLRVSPSQVIRAIAGKLAGGPILKHARVGRRILFKKEWLDEYLNELAALQH
jgi:excisionase family DNA binding protein